MVKKKTKIVQALVGVAVASLMLQVACGGSPAPQSRNGSSAPSSASGKELYELNCSTCHGKDGAGGIKMGDVSSSDLRQPTLQAAYKNDTSLLTRAITEGKNHLGNDLNPIMPRWQGRLTDQQISEIINYLKTLK